MTTCEGSLLDRTEQQQKQQQANKKCRLEVLQVISAKFKPILDGIDSALGRIEAVAKYLSAQPDHLVREGLRHSIEQWRARRGNRADALRVTDGDEGAITVPGYGIVEGLVREQHVAFLGMPYAKPPVGQLRWRPPQPLDPQLGSLPTRSARHAGPSCYQLRSDRLGEVEKMVLGVEQESEDCLYLNVYVPRNDARSGHLPVLLFIHGGGFSTGGSSIPLYDPVDLVDVGLRGQVIFVTFDYRLGIFGYAAGKALLAESSDPVGNYGLLDQLAAINWVKQNIAAFNGDPDNVTVMGHSAGAMSASYLQLLYPKLVSKWILLSGTAMSWHCRRADGAFENRVWEEIARGTGCNPDDVDAVRKADAEALIAIGEQFKMDHLFGPTIDGRLIRCEPWEMLEQVKDSIGPTIVSTVKDEASLFVLKSQVKDWDGFDRLMNNFFCSDFRDTIELIKQDYSDFKEPFSAANAVISDAMFVHPAERYFRTLPRAHFAVFDHPMVLLSVLAILANGADLGSFHGSELCLLFNFNPLITVSCVKEMTEMLDGLYKFVQEGAPIDDGADTSTGIWRRDVQPASRRRVWSLIGDKQTLSSSFGSLIV